MSTRFSPLFLTLLLCVAAFAATAPQAASSARHPQPMVKSAGAGTQFFPLKDLKPGMKGIGRTVFRGNTIEEFQVEILGVLENVGPKQSVILGRLSGGPLDKTGVMAGMSGSPVYIDGKLVGAVALSFPFSKEPIAGITPIEQMEAVLERAPGAPETIQVEATHGLASGRAAGGHATRHAAAGLALEQRMIEAMTKPVSLLPPNSDDGFMLAAGQPRLERIATPLVLSGFTARTLEAFAPQFRNLRLEPMQGGGGGSTAQNAAPGDASSLQPGSMISVQLIRGDLGINADGTVTYRDGERIYAFGHRFLNAGPVEMPFAASNVITLLPNTNNSFKISTPGRLLGAIRQDRATGILGMIGANPRMIPIAVTMRSSRAREVQYHFEMVNDRFLAPFLLQLAVFGVVDATERGVGDSSLALRGTISLDGLPPVRLENVFSGELGAGMLASQVAAVPLALLLQSGFPGLNVKGIDVEITSTDDRRVDTLDRIWSSKREVQPGDKIELSAVLRADDGTETLQKFPLEIPASVGAGPLQITVADGNSLNLSEVRELPGNFTPRDPVELIRALNNLRKNNRLYVRLSRPGTGFLLHGVQFPSPPPSLVRAMSSDASASTNVATTQVSILGESEMKPVRAMVNGTKTITVTVKN